MSDRTFHYGKNHTFTAKRGSESINLKAGANETLNLPADVTVGGIPIAQTQYLGSQVRDTTIQDVDMDESSLQTDDILNYRDDTDTWDRKQWRFNEIHEGLSSTRGLQNNNVRYNFLRLENHSTDPVKIRQIKYIVGGSNILQTASYTVNYYSNDGTENDYSGNDTLDNVTDGNDSTFFEMDIFSSNATNLTIAFEESQVPCDSIEILTTNDGTYKVTDLRVALLVTHKGGAEDIIEDTIEDSTSGDQTYTLFENQDFNDPTKQYVSETRTILKFDPGTDDTTSEQIKQVSNLLKPMGKIELVGMSGAAKGSLRYIYIDRLKILKNNNEEYAESDFQFIDATTTNETQVTNGGATVSSGTPDGTDSDFSNVFTDSGFFGGFCNAEPKLVFRQFLSDLPIRKIKVKPRAISDTDYGYVMTLIVDEKIVGQFNVNKVGDTLEQTFDFAFEGSVIECQVQGLHKVTAYISHDYFTDPFFSIFVQKPDYTSYRIGNVFAGNSLFELDGVFLEVGDYLYIVCESAGSTRTFFLNSSEHIFKVEPVLGVLRRQAITKDSVNKTFICDFERLELGVPFRSLNSDVQIGDDTPGSTVSIKGQSYPPEVDFLSNVNISSIADNEILQYNSSTQNWVNKTPAAVAGSITLDDLTDVTITSVSSGDLVKYDGSQWVNTSSVTVSDLSYVDHTSSDYGAKTFDAFVTSAVPTDTWLKPAYSKELGIISTIDNNGDFSLYSYDGISWVTETTGITLSGTPTPPIWCPNLSGFESGVFLLDDTSILTSIYVSYDGIKWEYFTNEGLDNSDLRFVESIQYFDKYGMLIAITTDDYYYYSFDAVNWVISNAVDFNVDLEEIFVGRDAVIIQPASDTKLLYSLDGINWSTIPVPGTNSNEILQIVWSDELDLWAALSSTEPIATLDPDTLSWTTRSTPSGSYNYLNYAKSSGRFIATDDSAGKLLESVDGITWTTRDFVAASSGITWSVEAADKDKKLYWIGTTGTGAYLESDYSGYQSTVDIGTRNVTDLTLHGETVNVGTGANSVKIGPNSSNIEIGPSNETKFTGTRLICNPSGTAEIDSTSVKIGAKKAREVQIESINGITEHPSYTTGMDLSCVTWGGNNKDGKFVALGSDGASSRIQYSRNGIDWTSATDPNSSSISYVDVVWAESYSTSGRFVGSTGISGSPDDGMIYSDDGITWQTSSATSAKVWTNLVWAPELSLFVAIGFGSTEAMTSPDGVTWTSRTLDEANNQQDLVWSSELELFVMVSNTGTNRVQTSPDGITWTGVSVDANLWNAVAWSPELGIFCAASGDGTYRFMTSDDGTSWAHPNSGLAPPQLDYRAIEWSSELKMFLATSNGGGVAFSRDGLVWFQRDIGVENWTDLTWSEPLGIFCAVSSTETNSNNNTFITKPFRQDQNKDVFIGSELTSGVHINAKETAINGVRQAAAFLVDKKDGDVQGGSATSDTWLQRDLTTIKHFGEEFASLSSNQFTLPRGKYLIRGASPFYRTDRTLLRVYDVTNSVEAFRSLNDLALSASSVSTIIPFSEIIETGAETTYELQYYCDTNKSDNGLGVDPPGSFDFSYYSYILIERLYEG